VVFTNDQLYQFDSAGAHLVGGGVQSAGLAFNANSAVLDVIFVDGSLVQFDAQGTHPLGKVF
jgi:hypothetical protein